MNHARLVRRPVGKLLGVPRGVAKPPRASAGASQGPSSGQPAGLQAVGDPAWVLLGLPMGQWVPLTQQYW